MADTSKNLDLPTLDALVKKIQNETPGGGGQSYFMDAISSLALNGVVQQSDDDALYSLSSYVNGLQRVIDMAQAMQAKARDTDFVVGAMNSLARWQLEELARKNGIDYEKTKNLLAERRG